MIRVLLLTSFLLFQPNPLASWASDDYVDEEADIAAVVAEFDKKPPQVPGDDVLEKSKAGLVSGSGKMLIPFAHVYRLALEGKPQEEIDKAAAEEIKKFPEYKFHGGCLYKTCIPPGGLSSYQDVHDPCLMVWRIAGLDNFKQTLLCNGGLTGKLEGALGKTRVAFAKCDCEKLVPTIPMPKLPLPPQMPNQNKK